MAGEHVEFQSLTSIRPSNKAFNKKFRFDYADDRKMRRYLEEPIIKKLQADEKMHEQIDQEFDTLVRDRELIRTVISYSSTFRGANYLCKNYLL